MTDLSFLPDEKKKEEETGFFDRNTNAFGERRNIEEELSFIPARDSGFTDAQKNFNLTADLNPDVEAKNYRLAKQTGVPPSLVRERPEAIEALTKKPNLYREALIHPKTVDFYKNFDNVAVTGADWAGLGKLEEILRESRIVQNVKKSFQVGKQNVQGGKLYTAKVLNNITGTESLELDKKISDFEAQRIKTPEDENFLETGITGAAEMLPLIFESVAGGAEVGFQTATAYGLATLAAGQAGPQAATPEEIVTVPAAASIGYLVGSRTGAVNAIFQIETGLAYDELKDIIDENGEKLDPMIASVAAVGIGSINSSLEFVGLTSLAKLIPGGQTLIGATIKEPIKDALKKESVRAALTAVGKKYAGVVGTETMTEMAQEVVNIFGAELAKDVAEVSDETLFRDMKIEEALPRIASAGREALAATIVLGIPGVTVSASKRVSEARKTTEFVERQTKINTAVHQTETKERSPEKMKEFFETNGIEENAFLGSEVVQELFQNDAPGTTELFERMGIDVKLSRESAEIGQDTKIDVATLQSNLSEEEFNTLIPDLKPAPSAISQRELEKVDILEEIQKTSDFYAEVFGEEQVFQDELKRVRTEAINAGENIDVVDNNLQLMESFANRMSLEGADKTEFIKKISIKGAVQRTDQKTELELDQLSDFSEENRLSNFDFDSATWKAIERENPAISKETKSATIYRATIGGEINTGDFVSLNKEVSEAHLENLKDRGETGEIITKKVAINDLKMGADATEFVYEPLFPQTQELDLVPQEESVKDIEKKWKDKVVNISLFEDEKVIDLNTIIIPKEDRKKGIGSAIVNDVIDYADRVGKRVELTPAVKDDFQGTTSRSRLVKFYKRFGFVENKGRNKDFTINAGKLFRNPSKIKKAIQGVKEFFQPKENLPRGSVKISDESNIITLFKDRNFSTLLHETGHIYFNEFKELASLPEASEGIQKDFQVLKTWLEVEEGQDIGREQQEQFARGFETWLLEGKAPTQELIPVFTRFKNWLISVYQSAVELKAPLTDDVREVLNRMFTAKNQIVAEAQTNEMNPWSKEQQDALGVVSDDRDFMKRLLNKSYEKSEAAMVKDRNKSARALRKTWKDLAEKQFEEAPNYKQAKLMREGDGINTQEIRDLYGDDLADIMSKKRISKVDGISVDESVQLSEFETAEEMFAGLIETQPKAEFIKSFVSEQRAAHDLLFKAEDYLSTTDEYSQFLEIKAKYLNRADGKPTEVKPRQIFKQFAKEWLDQQPVRDAVRVDRFMAAQAKYSRQESEALRQKNLVKGAKANELVRQNYELARESLKNKVEIGKLERLAKKIIKRDPGKILPEYRNAIYDVLLRFGMANPNKIKVDGEVNLVNLLNGEEMIDPFFASQTLLYSNDKTYKDIQMMEARDLRNLLKYLSIHGRTPDEQILRTGEKVIDVSTAMSNESIGLSPTKVKEQGTLAAKLTGLTRAFYKNFDSVNFVMTSMGGYTSIGKDGTFSLTERETSQAIAKAADDRHLKLLEVNEKIWPSYLQLLKTIKKLKKEHGDKITQNVPKTPSIMKRNGQTNWWRPEQILGLALNVGNESNRSRIFEGFQGMTETDLNRLLDFLTKEDWDAIQKIWDLNDEIFEEVNQVHFNINGYRVEKILAAEIKTKFGTYRGGYTPVRYDSKMAENAGGIAEANIANLHEKADLMSRQESRFQTPAPKSGFVKGRVATTPYPLLLSLEPIGDHISDTTHYITHAEVMRDVDRLVKTDPFKNAVRDHLGIEVYKELRPALQFIANPRKVSQDPQMDGLFGKFRRMATTWMLAYNESVAAKQFFSSPAAALKLGKRAWIGAYVKTIFDVPDIKNKYDFMLNNSAFMNARTNSFDQEFKKQFNSLKSSQKSVLFGDKLITWEDVVSIGFLPIKIVDMATVLPLWTTAYNQKMKDTGGGLPKNHDEAVKFADDVIRTTQPSSQALDLTKAQRSTGLWQLFSMFGTFTIGKYQQRVRMNWRAFKSNKISTPKYLETVFLEQLLPAVGMATVMQLMKGNDLGDDETIETLTKDAIQSAVTLPIPVLGSMLYPFSSYAFTLSPIENIAVAVQRPAQKLGKEAVKLLKGKRVNEEEAAKAAFWTVANLLSIWKRVPVSKVVKKIERKLEE